MSSDKANECGIMIDYLLDQAREGKLKYEYVLFHRQIYLQYLVFLIFLITYHGINYKC